MSILRWVVVFVCFLVMLFIAIQNIEQEVTVHLFNQEYANVHLALVLYASFGAGMVFVLLFVGLYVLRLNGRMHRLQKENRKVMEELNRLRNANIEDELVPGESLEGE
jgi:uncharacterized membrane protein YciS (DUF1049 family)